MSRIKVMRAIFTIFQLILATAGVTGQGKDSILTPRDTPHPENVVGKLQLSKKDLMMKTARSIAHGEGSERKCDHMDDLKKFLPDLDSPKEPRGGRPERGGPAGLRSQAWCDTPSAVRA